MKFQERIVTEGSRALAILAGIIKSIELDSEDLDVQGVSICFNNRCTLDIEDMLWRETVEVRVAGAPWIREGEQHLEDINVEIIMQPENLSIPGIKLKDIYEKMPEIVLRLDSTLLKNLAARTTWDGMEYIVLYMEEGASLILEGEVHKVTIPGVEALAIVHTHPEGACNFSEIDVKSTAFALADLAFFEATATPTCFFYIARIGFISEADFEKLLNNRWGIDSPVNLDTVRMGRLSM